MVPAWLIIICWAHLELLVITRTDKLWLVPSNYLFFGWVCFHSCVTSLKFHRFLFKWEENLANIESLAGKYNTLERNGFAMVATWLKQRESITLDSNSPAVRVILVSM